MDKTHDDFLKDRLDAFNVVQACMFITDQCMIGKKICKAIEKSLANEIHEENESFDKTFNSIVAIKDTLEDVKKSDNKVNDIERLFVRNAFVDTIIPDFKEKIRNVCVKNALINTVCKNFLSRIVKIELEIEIFRRKSNQNDIIPKLYLDEILTINESLFCIYEQLTVHNGSFEDRKYTGKLLRSVKDESNINGNYHKLTRLDEVLKDLNGV